MRPCLYFDLSATHSYHIYFQGCESHHRVHHIHFSIQQAIQIAKKMNVGFHAFTFKPFSTNVIVHQLYFTLCFFLYLPFHHKHKHTHAHTKIKKE